MAQFTRIACQGAADLMASTTCQIVDIRDAMSYQQGHPAGAAHLTNETFPAFLRSADKTQPTLVFCYHGNSSQGAAQALADQGFTQVYSVDGGAEMWRSLYPDKTVNS